MELEKTPEKQNNPNKGKNTGRITPDFWIYY